MNRFIFFPSIAGLIAAAFIQCSNSVSVGGGTGTETVNTFALRPDGRPAAGATARIIDSRWWFDSVSRGTSPILGESKADDNGFIHLTYPKHFGAVNFQIDHIEDGLLLSLPTGAGATDDTVHLKPYASVTGTIVTDAASAATCIALAGTSYRQTVTNSGDFSFKKVAPGSYAILCLAEAPASVAVVGSTTLTLDAGDNIDTLSVMLNANRVLVDNFEGGIGPPSLGRLFPVFGWYVLSDSLYFLWDTTRQSWKEVKVPNIGTSQVKPDSAADGNGGKAIRVTANLDTISPYANALFGLSFDPFSRQGVNLTTMTGCSFRASGSGTIQIHFETRDLDSATDRQSHYSYTFKLQPTMRNYSIPVDSLRIYEPITFGAAHPWIREARHVLRIEFEFTAAYNIRGKELYMVMDDFYLNGVSLAALSGLQ